MKRPLDGGESAPKLTRGRPKVSLVLTRYPPMKRPRGRWYSSQEKHWTTIQGTWNR